MKKKIKHLTHGFSGDSDIQKKRFYWLWDNIRQRCNNPQAWAYKYYGGRGIKCGWERFEDFKTDMYESYLEHKANNKSTTIDRIDNAGSYCKKNCRWSTRSEQLQNYRRNVRIEIDGETKNLKEWARHFKVNYYTIYERVKRYGWSWKKAFTEPVAHYYGYKRKTT